MTKSDPLGGNHDRPPVLLTYVPTLPSSEAPASGSTPGLVLAPFRGVRYAEDRVSGLAQVTSPPYDVIAADNEHQLMASDPHNVVRLILPRHQAGQPGSPYEDAAAELRSWLGGGILVPDAEPALYVYEQVAVDAAGQPDWTRDIVQRGLIGALGLLPYQAGVVQPHEAVAPGPVSGRRQLMEATKANLEPIFLLYRGGDGAARALVDEVAARPPLSEARTPDGLRHRLWAITDPGELAAIAADLAPRTALIADGHHRYAAYLQVQERLRAAAGAGPWDLGLALLVDSDAYPPRVGAIHRVIDGLVPEVAARLAESAFTVRELPGGTADVRAALAALAEACDRGSVAFLLTGNGRAYLLTDPDRAQLGSAVTDQPAELWQQLCGAVLEGLLFARIWGIEDDDRSVKAVHDAAEAIKAADSESGGTAVICCPMSAAQVYEVAALGQRVPRKSTSFGPKPRTGLVLRLFAEG